ncbi:alpha/beta fold hydrolase [Massilia sp. LXY-6]|uniref:alpha/beta fold hydrolase n=1 Tax=Massilia sp. LXY-6 TaxID=3379823 RepID=UPI003EE1F5B0
MTPFLTLAASVIGVLLLWTAILVLFTWYTARKVEIILPPKGRFVDLAGTRLHVREFGEQRPDAPAILMIHGLAGQLSHYTYGVAGRLAERHRVVVVDRPGSGYSTRAPGTPADLSTQAASLAALIRTLDIGPAFVVGHSLGGAVALTLALEHPKAVAGLALLAPLTHMREDVPPVFKGLTIVSPLARKLVAWTLAVPSSIKNSRPTLDIVFGPEPVPKDFAMKGGGLLSLRPSAFLSASADLQALPDHLPQVQARYPELRLPVHVLYGKDDRILDWKLNGQALVDKVPGARLRLIEGGHMLPVTQAEATAEFIEAALQGLPADAAATR